jgi:hypothetical protein
MDAEGGFLFSVIPEFSQRRLDHRSGGQGRLKVGVLPARGKTARL